MLDHTPKEIKEREALVINPAKTCQPLGATYAALGIHRCLPHSHGSQGCQMYFRGHLNRHFREPAEASTSSFTEGACVFGGMANLKTAIQNVFNLYDPDMIAIHTTCLSETIGDDLPTIIKSSEKPEGKLVIHANTPSYVGSHITGFSNMTAATIKYLSENSGTPNNKLLIVPGFVNPGDMREIKRILKAMGVDYTMLPDTSGVMDAPLTGNYHIFPQGGTRIPDIIDAGNCLASIGLGDYASGAACKELENKCEVPSNIMDTPMSIDVMDDLLMLISRLTGKEIPAEMEEERGQVIDMMADLHQHYFGKRVAIFGDPDIMIGLTNFLLELGMIPAFVLTGTPTAKFEKRIDALFQKYGVQGKAKAAGDLFSLHQWIKNEPVDLLIGNTYGKYIARAEDIPFVRVGFPIMDRGVHSYQPIVGYRGLTRLLEMMGNALLERQERDSLDEDIELIM
ncbi:nitrogenase molybdenum-iron protein subunit beta [Fundidesulfovibrio putealis]|uniref:nitrogenase molybdenum-iron protein subunit beta n=1 Tax=Fundidesulfovibrio putealis TaxID=270496 RepID=UPI0003F5BA04|nr:nitrogenase molybdenum-iron protein subunit beta [Fundidesulfovibrio putealis]